MTNCDACVNYEYDEDYECYCCKMCIRDRYVLYYRYIGERLNEPKLINNILKQKDAGLYLIRCV